jgi:transcriptional regulator with PAS, ATPase and Fis domain
LQDVGSNLPAVINSNKKESDFSNERELLYKVLFDMKRDLNDVKKLTLELIKTGNMSKVKEEHATIIDKLHTDTHSHVESFVEKPQEPEENDVVVLNIPEKASEDKYQYAEDIEEEESLSIQKKELELIKKSLEKYNGKRKDAAEELGISERTLYRKIKQYNL